MQPGELRLASHGATETATFDRAVRACASATSAESTKLVLLIVGDVVAEVLACTPCERTPLLA